MYTRKNRKKANQIKNKDFFGDVKSKYILQKIFVCLRKKKKLDIIKHNKNIKKRININIDDYEEYSELFSSIIIEIIPNTKECGQFINIKKGDEKYYHIFFNDNKKEIKRPRIFKRDDVQKIKIIINYKVKSFNKLFFECKLIKSIKFKQFLRKNITDMISIFEGCSSLNELNLNSYKTDNITNMSRIFWECSSLKELNLNNFNTINVTNMSGMFRGSSSLKELNLNNFNTINVTSMSGMFCECSEELIMKIRNQYNNIIDEAFEV